MVFNYNTNESCFIDAAKNTFNAVSNKELCEKIDLRYSYGTVTSKEFAPHYDSRLWLLRKVSWVVIVPLKLVCIISALACSLIYLAQKNEASAKNDCFCAIRLCEGAIGDLISIFSDRIGQHWITDGYVHIKLYCLVKHESLDLRQRAFDDWFRPHEEVQNERLEKQNDRLRDAHNSNRLAGYLASIK